MPASLLRDDVRMPVAGCSVVIERFEGKDRESRLLQALAQQRGLCNIPDAVQRVASLAEVKQFDDGEVLISEDGAESDVYFLLAGGHVDVSIKDRWIATRQPGDQVGEMAALDPSAPRSATVRSVGTTVTARISDTDYLKLLAEHPATMWPAVAGLLAGRLRERSKFIRPRTARPCVFIGSSSERLDLAQALRSQLRGAAPGADVEVWNEGVFAPSSTNIESLASSLGRFDFGVFLFSPDDVVISRGRKHVAPRDNVILEFGLFAGALGRERVFSVAPRTRLPAPSWTTTVRRMLGLRGPDASTVKRPTDLLGVVWLEYDQALPIPQALEPAVAQLATLITSLQPR